MKPDYWLERWQQDRIGFHRADVNPELASNLAALNGTIRVLVPLCGKSVDLEYLAAHGFEVVGVELSELAARSFFSERGISPERREHGDFVEFAHGAVSIFVGDFFETNTDLLGHCDAAYDRAAMIALPADMRARYVSHLRSLLVPGAKLLLVTLFYDAEGGPPFSVSPEEVQRAYAGARIRELGRHDARNDAPGPVARGATFEDEITYAIELTPP